MELLRNVRDLSGELWQLKRYAPEITSAFEYFDQSEDPKKALEEIINTAKNNPALDDLLKITKTYDMVLRAEQRVKEEGYNWYNTSLEALKETGVNYEIRGAENIPANGALWISNHPYGLLDGIILLGGLGSLISKEKRKLKIIGMNQLRFIKRLEEVVYFVHSTVKGPNMSLRKPLRYLSNGGDLAIYPSGRMSKAGLEEYPWKKSLGTFVSHSEYVVPMWFSGPNHAKIYNLLAKIKRTEKLRRVFSLRETWDKDGETIVLNIGERIRSEELKEIENTQEMVQHLRDIAEALKVDV